MSSQKIILKPLDPIIYTNSGDANFRAAVIIDINKTRVLACDVYRGSILPNPSYKEFKECLIRKMIDSQLYLPTTLDILDYIGFKELYEKTLINIKPYIK